MSLEDFFSRYDRLKTEEKSAYLDKLSKAFPSSNTLDITKFTVDRAISLITKMLESHNILLILSCLRFIPVFIAKATRHLGKTNSIQLLLKTHRLMGDNKMSIRELAFNTLRLMENLVNEYVLIYQTKTSNNPILVEYSIKLLKSYNIKTPSFIQNFREFLKKLLSNSNFKVRTIAEKTYSELNKEFPKVTIGNFQRGSSTTSSGCNLNRSILKRQLSDSKDPKPSPYKIRFQSQKSSRQTSPVKSFRIPSNPSSISYTAADLKIIWEDRIDCINATLKREVIKDEIHSGLSKISVDWVKRATLLKRLRGIVEKFYQTDSNQLANLILSISDALIVTIKDLRSKIHVEIFATLSFISYRLCEKFGNTCERLIAEILPIFTSSSLPSVSSASACLDIIFTHTQCPRLYTQIQSHFKQSKSVPIRKKCASLILVVCNNWTVEKLYKISSNIQLTISFGLVDACTEVRTIMAMCFWKFRETFRQLGDDIYTKLEDRIKKLVNENKPYITPSSPQTKLVTLPKPELSPRESQQFINDENIPVSESDDNPIVGPPGYTPFVSAKKLSVLKRDCPQILLTNSKIDSIVTDFMKGININQCLTELLEMFKNKSKLTLTQICQIKKSLFGLFESEHYDTDKLLDCLFYFISYYTLYVGSDIPSILQKLSNIYLGSNFNDNQRIYEIIHILQTNFDDDAIINTFVEIILTKPNIERSLPYFNLILKNATTLANTADYPSLFKKLISAYANNGLQNIISEIFVKFCTFNQHSFNKHVDKLDIYEREALSMIMDIPNLTIELENKFITKRRTQYLIAFDPVLVCIQKLNHEPLVNNIDNFKQLSHALNYNIPDATCEQIISLMKRTLNTFHPNLSTIFINILKSLFVQNFTWAISNHTELLFITSSVIDYEGSICDVTEDFILYTSQIINFCHISSFVYDALKLFNVKFGVLKLFDQNLYTQTFIDIQSFNCNLIPLLLELMEIDRLEIPCLDCLASIRRLLGIEYVSSQVECEPPEKIDLVLNHHR